MELISAKMNQTMVQDADLPRRSNKRNKHVEGASMTMERVPLADDDSQTSKGGAS